VRSLCFAIQFAHYYRSYGKQGDVIIQNTVMRMYNPNQMGPHIAPLNSMQFTLYLLVPHIACRLIQQDFECDMDEAHKIMIKSGDDGQSLYPVNEDDSDSALDKIIKSNCAAARHNGTMNITYDSDTNDPGAVYEVVQRAPKGTTAVGSSTRPKPRQIRRINTTASPSMPTMDKVAPPKPRQTPQVNATAGPSRQMMPKTKTRRSHVQIVDFEANEVGSKTSSSDELSRPT